jgi:predicted small secreted protein
LVGKAAAAGIIITKSLTKNERPKPARRVTIKRNAQKDAKIN